MRPGAGRRPFEWLGRLRAQRLRRRAQRLFSAGNTCRAIRVLYRAVRLCPQSLLSSCILAANILRQEAATEQDLIAARSLYKLVIMHPSSVSRRREHAQQQLMLLACQCCVEEEAATLLGDAGYEYRLSSEILAYPLSPIPHNVASAPATGYAHVVDNVLPPGLGAVAPPVSPHRLHLCVLC